MTPGKSSPMSEVMAARTRPGSTAVILLFPADPSGDEMARQYISTNLQHPQANAWTALRSPDRLEQTIRVLQGIQMNVIAQAVDRRADVADALADFVAEKITKAVYLDVQAEFEDWNARSSWFRNGALERLRECRALLKQQNVRETAVRDAAEGPLFRDLLAKLVQAVCVHEKHFRSESSPEDRLLWARLDLLFTPAGDPIRDLVKRQGSYQSMSRVLDDAMEDGEV